jgi:hypothetical protein
MAFITGATVTFTDYSAPGTPRILNIPDAWGDVTVQDVWDTLSEIAAELDNLIYKKLIDRPKGGGKGVLSASKSVGITLMQNNVQIKFHDQAGPTYVIKRVIDGNAVAQDHLEAEMEAIASSDFTNWKNEADVSAALIAGSSITAADVWTHNMTEDYPVDGQSAMTPAQAQYAVVQLLTEFARTGALVSVKKRDGTEAFQLTLDAIPPTASEQSS